MKHAPLNILWFKRDLRIGDHRALAQAAKAGPVMPLYIAEPALWQQSDASARQWEFVAESLAELRAALAALGQPLIVRTGDAVTLLERARARFGNVTLWSHEETGNGWTYQRDLAVAAWAKANSVPWHEIKQSGVIRRIKSRNGWAKNWDSFMAEPITPPPKALPPLADVSLGHIPTSADLCITPDPCPHRQIGGTKAAHETLDSFLYQRGAPYRKAMSSPSLGALHCSRISPHLAWGTLSSREAAQATWARQAQLKEDGTKSGWRGSMRSFEGRLHWRDHFMQKLEDEPCIERNNLHTAYNGLRPSLPDQTRLEAWQKGQTGLPFVDACMRALNATGWMNFRMRAMLMAVSSHHLWLDWQTPGAHLARQFTDYEPGIHWPQVQMQSGTTGINTVRIYNPVKQGYDQDTDGAFTRKWLPELWDVPDEFIHEPWRWPGAQTLLGKTYPFPVIDHLAAAKEARQKVWAIRKSGPYQADAQRIVTKHASRKKPPSRASQKPKAPPSNQLTLPLD